MRKNRLGQYILILLVSGFSADNTLGHSGRPTDPPVTLDPVEVRPPSTPMDPWEPWDPWGGNPGYGDPGNGGDFNPNPGDGQDVRNATEDDPCLRSGNPVVLSTGNKVETEFDFQSSGEMPLTLRRTYNHYWKYVGLFGQHWVSSFDFSLVWTPGDSVIYAQRPDGRRIKFVRVGTTNRWNEDKAQSVAYILKNGDGTYTHYSESLPLERYDGGGRPLDIKNLQGIGWTFSYANDYLQQITHTSGRSVLFTWTSGALTKITAPDGSAFSYDYQLNAYGAGKHRLIKTTTPGAIGNPAVAIDYFHENASFPGALTGKAYGGVRYSWFTYDTAGRTTLSAHGASQNIDRYTYAYTAGGTTTPPNPPPDPPPPGASCNPSTHICNNPARGSDPIPPEILENEKRANEEAEILATVSGTLTTVETNPYGKVARYAFTDGRLVGIAGDASASCPARSRTIGYDANGNENLVQDFNGTYALYAYNAKGQRLQKIDAYNTAAARTTNYTWDPAFNRMTSETVVGDHETTYSYNASHRLAAVTVKNLSSNGVLNETHTWAYTYTLRPNGLVQTMVADGPLATADQITYSYGLQGELIQVSNTLGHSTVLASHNALGQPGRVTGPNGDITDYAYYPGGLLKQATSYPGGTASTTSYTYAIGLLETVKRPDTITTTYSYDATRRLTTISRPEIHGIAEHRIAYNAASDPVRVEQWRASSQVLRYRAYNDYDELGRVIAQRGNNGQNVRYGYDSNDNLKTITDSLNRITRLDYDERDRLVRKTDAKNGITRYEYDNGDRLKKITDPRNLATLYTYDGFGQLRALSSPDSGATSYGYTSAGLRSSMARANGKTETYAYDAIGRLTSIAVGGQSRGLYYDTCTNGKGRLCRVEAPDNTIQYQYEADGRIRSRNDQSVVGGVSSSYTTSYGYDGIGRLTRLTYPSGIALTYGYTTGQLNTMDLTQGGVTTNLVNDTRYQPFDVLVGYTTGSGLVRRYEFDLDLRPTALYTTYGTQTLQKLTYTHNANNLMTSVSDVVASSQDQTFAYDELSRLTSANGAGSNRTYGYDASGNRILTNGIAHTISGTGNRMTGTSMLAAGSTFTHDGAGNTVNYTIPGWGSVGYVYGAFNQMQSVNVPGGQTVGTYGYNGYGERTTKDATHGRYRYQYTEDHRLLSERMDQSGVWTNYLWYGNELVGLLRGSQLYYLSGDHLGKPQQATNTSRTVVWQLSGNDPYGIGTVTQDSIGGLNLGLPGQYFDSESGLYYNLNRYYDAVHGRYWSSDPIGQGGGINTYAYAKGSPTNSTDSLGLKPGDCYATADIAAANAIFDINPTSIREDREYAGWVYRMENGFFSYTAPRRGGRHESSPGERVGGALGKYHTHGAESGPEYDDENFSPEDMNIKYGDFAWLGTPSESIKRFSTGGSPFKNLQPPKPNNGDSCGCEGKNTFWNQFINSF